MASSAATVPPAPPARAYTGNRPGRTGFVRSILADHQSTQGHPLQMWFVKPPKNERELIPEALVEGNSGPSYVGRPDELRRPPLIRKAEMYYLKDTLLSRSMVRLVTVLVFLPALVVYAIGQIKVARDPELRRFLEAQRAKRVSVDGSGSVPGHFEIPTAARKAYEFDTPWLFARSWALWVVYVPITRYFGRGGLKGAILPSHTPKFQNEQAEAIREGRKLMDRVKMEVMHLKKLHRHAVVVRRRVIIEAGKKLDEIKTYGDNPLAVPARIQDEYEALLEEYRAKTKIASELQTALQASEEEVELVRNAANTETCASATNYKGVADWAQDALDSYSNILTAMISVCFVGAGLTYSAIFSATRGSLGLMSWSFSLFLVGLAILITVQSLLVWCSRVENYPFSTPSIWELALGTSVYGASAAVVAAIVLLVVTVLDLSFNGPSGPDSPLVFSVPPKGAAIAAFSAIGVGVAIAIVVFIFFAVSNSPQTLLWRRSIERSRKPRVRLSDFA